MTDNIKRHPITSEQFDYLTLQPNWKMVAVPPQNWPKIPNLPRPADTLAIYASGCSINTQTHLNIEHVGACDIVAYEDNPDIKKNEGHINVYHCLFQKLKTPSHGLEYIMHYPFKTGSIIGHWPKGDIEVLQPYFDATQPD